MAKKHSLDTEEATRDPLLAALSASLHGVGLWRGPEVSKAAWRAVETLAPHQTQTLKDLIYLTARRSAQVWMEKLMDPQTQERLVKAAQERIFLEGKLEGKAEGKVEGKLEALLSLLQAKGLSLSDAQKEMVSSCRELSLLERWFQRAISATTPEDVFSD